MALLQHRRPAVDHYTAYNVRAVTALGELLTLSQVAVQIPRYTAVERGVIRRPSTVDVRGTLTVRTKTLNALTVLAAAGGSWQRMPALPFVNLDVTSHSDSEPLPLLITMINVVVQVNLSEMDRRQGHALEHTLDFGVAGRTLLNGVPLLEKRPPINYAGQSLF